VPATNEAAGWCRLVAAVADEVVVTVTQEMHQAVSDGTYRWLGPPARPVQRCTDAASAAAFRAVRAGLRGAGELGALLAGARQTDDAASGENMATPPSRAALKARAIAHGVIREQLLEVAPELDQEVTFRLTDGGGPIDPARLPALLPAITSRPVVFVHGLVDTEQVWLPVEGGGVSLPAAVANSGATPVLVRYGTGRTIARNGRDLARLLGELLDSWPVPVTSLTLVGHSMGGLLIRAACAAAADRGQTWLERLADIVYLGTPHLGSWLEKFANVTSWSLRHASPHSAPIGRFLDARSQGIKDLRFGTTDETAWDPGRIDALLTGRPQDAPWLERARHHLVVGRLHPDPRHPVNSVLGDALVRASSASATGRWRRIHGSEPPSLMAVGASHTRLPRDPEVAQLLGGVLSAA
jgi:pimeloyl-ACP methyl ester carboxylesterase